LGAVCICVKQDALLHFQSRRFTDSFVKKLMQAFPSNVRWNSTFYNNGLISQHHYVITAVPLCPSLPSS